MNQPLIRQNSRNSSLQLLASISNNKSKISNTSLRTNEKNSRKTLFTPSIKPKPTVKKVSLNEKFCAKANTIRTTLLLNIDGERSQSQISECKINSKTAVQILASYDSFEVIIENPVEIGTPVLYISRQSCDSGSTPKRRINLEEKMDFTGFVSKLRKKKTISMAKFSNFVESSLGLPKEKKKRAMKNKDSKYELMIQSCQYLRSVVYQMKKEKKCKSKLLSQDNFNLHDSLGGFSSQSQKNKTPKIKKNRKSNGSSNSSNNNNKSLSESDDDDIEDVVFVNANSGINTSSERSKNKKAITSLAFTYSSFKSVSNQNTNNTFQSSENANNNFISNTNGHIIILHGEEENEMPENSYNILDVFGSGSPILIQDRERYSTNKKTTEKKKAKKKISI